MKVQIARWLIMAMSKKAKTLNEFENMRLKAELDLLSHTSIERPLSDKEHLKFIRLGKQYFK